MSSAVTLSVEQLAKLRLIALTLIPGDGASPTIAQLPDYEGLLQRAAAAVGSDLGALLGGLDLLPSDPDWATLSKFADAEPESFELISSVAVGAYFMSPLALESIGWPTGQRRRAPQDQAVDELGYGILEPVLARGSLVRLPPDTSEGSS